MCLNYHICSLTHRTPQNQITINETTLCSIQTRLFYNYNRAGIARGGTWPLLTWPARDEFVRDYETWRFATVATCSTKRLLHQTLS